MVPRTTSANDALCEVLLIRKVLVRRYHQVKPMTFGRVQQIAIRKTAPAFFIGCANLMTGKETPNLIGNVFIEQNAQAAGFRRSRLRP